MLLSAASATIHVHLGESALATGRLLTADVASAEYSWVRG